MRVGISSFWFNRGQGVVGRHLRSALDELGHETFVLARPTRGGNLRPSFIDKTGVWDQPGVTAASRYEIPGRELRRWAKDNEIEAALFDQNYQFEEIAKLRESGVRTIGRFVWEHFSAEHVAPAQEAFDLIYSMTAVEQERYARMGIDSPRVRWGCHPELLNWAGWGPAETGEAVRLLYPGGFMSARKPIAAVLDAFSATTDPRLRLIVKAQVDRHSDIVATATERDERIEAVTEDLPEDEHIALFASSHACLAPSRWEGLGLHLYEATALGMPIITNDNPPMNEIVIDGVNGLLVPGVPSTVRPRSDIGSFDPDLPALTRA
jgi:glycosyltransferase involved in cell wall biosynthesis